MSLLIFSIQNAFRKKAVAVLAVLGVALGCALMTFLFSVAAGMEKRVETTFNEMSGRLMLSQRYTAFGGALLGLGSSNIPASYMDLVKNVPHIKSVSAQVSAILRPSGLTFIMPLYGYELNGIAGQSNTPFKKIVEGAAPENYGEVVIGKSLQEYMKFLNNSYEVGGVYPFIIHESGQKTPRTQELKIVGVYQTGNEVLDGGFSGTDKLARDIGKVPAGMVSVINAQIDSMDNVEAASQEIERVFVGKKPEVQVSVPRELLIPLKNVLRIFDGFLLAVSVVAVAAGGLSIMVVMLLSVIERKREFGILKALGWTPRDIVFMVLVESVFLSLLGAVLGTTLGYAGLAAAKNYVAIDIGSFNWQVAAVVCFCGVLVGTVGGLYPGWRANKSAPAEILRGV